MLEFRQFTAATLMRPFPDLCIFV